jgi:hypothetical protein
VIPGTQDEVRLTALTKPAPSFAIHLALKAFP